MEEAEWDTAYINDLPESAFAYVEPGEKEDGKKQPLSKRHFPIRDASGKLDPAHVANAASRAPQSPFGDKAMPKILAAEKELKIGTVDYCLFYPPVFMSSAVEESMTL